MAGKQMPVLVVGGRTTGLMMAAELARYGIAVRIIDKSPGIDPHSRATYVRARTLEIFHGLGLADQIIAKGQPLKAVSIYANGKHVATSPELPVDSPFPFGAAYAQNKTEAILENHLNQLGVEVERNTELIHFDQTADEIRATIRKPDGAEEHLRCPWLIGCDGAHSITRKLIDETFPGEIDRMPYMGADVIMDGPSEIDMVYLCLHDRGDLFIFLLDEGRRQIVATLPKNSPRTEPPTLEEMQQLLDERGFGEFTLSDPRWLTIYHLHYRVAPHYGHGRAFLAGDAAHIHSFIGGQGMNTGIQDAHNLAWKLAFVIRGDAPPWWLDTYESERRGIAKDVAAWTKQATEELTLFSELSQPERDRIVEHMALPESERMKIREHEEEIDLDYRSSRLCLDTNDDVELGVGVGSRAPDASPLMAGGKATTLIETISGPRFHLMLFGRKDSDAADSELTSAAADALKSASSWLDVLIIGSPGEQNEPGDNLTLVTDPENRLRERYDGDVFRLYLIRPDGYVAYRSREVTAIDEYLSRVKQ